MSLSLPHRPAPDPLTTSHGADPPKDNLGSGSRTNGTSSEDTSDQQSVGAETSFANYKSRIANQVGQQTVYGGQYIILYVYDTFLYRFGSGNGAYERLT